MSNLKVAILVPPEVADAPADRADTYRQAEEIHQCLTMLGHQALTMIFGSERRQTERELLEARPDCVVNLVEDLPEGPDQQHRVTECLDRLAIPYTGAGTAALRALADKRHAKEVMRQSGLPTPGGLGDAICRPAATAAPARYIVKSAIEHASIGLDAASVVHGSAAALALLGRKQAGGGTWFAEEYVDGREFNVAIVETSGGLLVLPVAEILFLDHAGRAKIVGYAEKWHDGSAAYATTPRTFPAGPGDAALLTQLRDLALAGWRLFGLSGYARIDFRVDAAGVPYILEVNANPCLAADAGFCAAASEAGMTQTDIVAHLIETALARPDPLAPDRRAG